MERHRIGRRLIVITGLAGAGKTEIGLRLARKLGAALIDKDDTSALFTEALLAQLGSAPSDRESDIYLSQVRPLEYAQMLHIARSNLKAGLSVVMVAPFVGELQDMGWYEIMLDEADAHDVALEVLWIRTDPETMRTNLMQRGAERDRGKLAHWDQYITTAPWSVPPACPHRVVDNSFEKGRGQVVFTVRKLISSWTKSPHSRVSADS